MSSKGGGRILPPSGALPTEKHADVTRVKVSWRENWDFKNSNLDAFLDGNQAQKFLESKNTP